MDELFLRTLSQGLQAFMPVSCCVAWLQRNRQHASVQPIQYAVLVTVPLTIVSAWAFQHATHQARWESLLATFGLALSAFARKTLWPGAPVDGPQRPLPYRSLTRRVIAGAAVLLIVRQTMEMAVVLAAAVALRSWSATAAIIGGLATAAIAAYVWMFVSRHISDRALTSATRGFTRSPRTRYVLRPVCRGLRELTVLHENVECPSLSPSNRLIAFKKKVGDLSTWRLYVLDATTMKEWAVGAEMRSFDDQIEWLDDGHVLYAMSRSSQSPISDVWVAPVDGTSAARVFLPEAESPIIVRPTM